MKGYIEHDSRACKLGGHTNRGPVDKMCPVYLELRRRRLREHMQDVRFLAGEGVSLGNAGALY